MQLQATSFISRVNGWEYNFHLTTRGEGQSTWTVIRSREDKPRIPAYSEALTTVGWVMILRPYQSQTFYDLHEAIDTVRVRDMIIAPAVCILP